MIGYCELKSEGCKGHLGKYPNCLTEALHQATASMIGFADEENGDVDSPYGYRWLIIAKEQITIKADAWDGGFDFHVAADQYFIIVTNDQGHVTLFAFDTEEQARADWAEFEAAYNGEWLGDDDE